MFYARARKAMYHLPQKARVIVNVQCATKTKDNKRHKNI
jgi:hypothetical protein